MLIKIEKISILAIITILISSIYFYTEKINLFHLKKINIKNNNFVKKEEVNTLLEKYIDVKINNLSISNLQDTINNHPYIKANKVYKIIPNTIVVDIKEIIPIALFEEENSYFFLDNNGDKIKSNIESINYFSVPIMGNIKNNKKENIVKMLNVIRKNNMRFFNTINEINISEEIVTFKIDSGTKIKMSKPHDINSVYKLLSFLRTIKNNKNISDYKYVDLTIPKQIIVKENNKL